MTACTKSQGAPLGKKAVSAAVAGALAAGMVPAVALAAPAGEQPGAGDGISELALSAQDDFAAGKVSGLKVAGETIADLSNIDTPISSITKNIEGADSKYTLAIALTQVTTSTGAVVNIGDQTGITYEMLASTSATAPEDWASAVANTELTAATAGSYWVQATLPAVGDITVDALKPYAGATIAFKINVVNESLANAYMYQMVDGKEVKTFTFDNKAIDPSFKLPNAEDALESTDYDVVYYDVATGKQTTAAGNGAEAAGGAPKNAGSYVAYVKGADTYAGSNVQIPFTIEKLNLASADLKVPTVSGTTAFAPVLTIDGSQITGDDLSALLTTAVSPIDNNEAGSYTFKFAPQSTQSDNIIGTKEVETYRTAAQASWSVGTNNTVATPYDAGEVILSATTGNTPFDVSSVVAKDAAGNTVATKVTVQNDEGEVVPTSSVSQPGSWTITYTVDAAATEYATGGTFVVNTTVYAGVITSNDVIVKQDGQVTNAPSFIYDGENVIPELDVTVKSGDKTLVAGTDYTIVASLNGNEVSEAVNANAAGQSYAMTVNAPAYKFDTDADTFNVTIQKASIAVLNVADQVNADTEDTADDFLVYTGEAITPVLQYKAATTDKAWTALPADQFNVSYSYKPFASDGTVDTGATSTTPTEMKAAGQYTITIAPKNATVAANYTLGQGLQTVVVVKEGAKVFQDVPATAWFYEPVNEAEDQGYMNGYNGTKLFGPNDKITRGQVACVLFNMAGGTLNNALGSVDDSYNENLGYVTGFSDVNGKMYYAEAIAWAKQAKVINGYAGTDKFGPDDFVTREQFAAMLANYAKAMGKDIAVEDVAAVLASKPDGGQVSDWAKDSVAWAVSNKYMGNGGVIAPLGSITRAEVAAMAVNYQPKALA